jgi:RNA polymerase sigma factor (sigma-70 family)
MACKNGGTKHNWIVSEKDHDFDVCTECGATRNTKKFDTRRGLLSISQLEEDENEIGDNGDFVNNLEAQIYLSLELERMTPRQKEVAEMILDGYKEREVAEHLNISASAVSHIVKRIKNKLPF